MDFSYRDLLLAVAVATLVAVAGCTGANGPSTATPTDNSTSMNDTQAEEIEPLQQLNGSYLNNATTAAVEDGGSYTRTTSYYYELNTTLQQGSSWTNSSQRVDFAADRGVRDTTTTVLGTPPSVTTSTVYTDENASYSRVNNSQGVSYNMQSGLEAVNLTTYRQNYTFLTAAFEYEANGTATVGDTTTVRYTSTNLSDDSYLGGDGNVTVANSSSTLYVDADGAVRRMTAAYTLEADSGTSRTELTITLTDVGATTVTEPSWLDDARNSTTETSP